MTTTENITTTQIQSLRDEAANAGDPGQVVLCQMAMGDTDPTDGVDGYDGELIASHDRDSAKRACAEVISYAEALED